MEIYRNIPQTGPWEPAARQLGLICKKRGKQIADRSLGTGRPAAGGQHFFCNLVLFAK